GRIAKESIQTFFRAQFSAEPPAPVERKPVKNLKYSAGEEPAGGTPKQSKSIPNWGKKKKQRKEA
ncbi:MAG TPA: hypothetical protein VF678_10745, partial [bacterium]